MEWNESFSMNIQDIDNQHKKLFDIITKLEFSIKSGTDNFVLSEIFEELKAYSLVHFSTEERYFDEFHFSESDKHKEEHAMFVQNFENIHQEYLAGKINLSSVLLPFLKDWLITHIKGSDKKYVFCFHEHGLR